MTSKKEDKVSLIGLAVFTLEFIPGIVFPRPVLNPARWYTAVPKQIDDTTTNNTASRGQIQYLLKV
jgi:hypothetical protein